MKIAILGNGFDLCHGLKTSFVDYRKYLVESNHISLVNRVDEIIKKQKPNFATYEVILSWNEFESIIGDHFNKNNNSPDQINLLEDLLEDFVEKFYLYLQEASKQDCKKIKSICDELNNVDAIITFNYTNIYKMYLKNTTLEVFHIHGTLIEEFYPVIGYFHERTIKTNSDDYSMRYGGKVIHKPALAYKQNGIDLDSEILNFKNKYTNKINEVVSIGYSYGSSDMHIFDILNTILVKQFNEVNVRTDLVENMQVIKYKIFNYSDEESKNIQQKIISNLNMKFRRQTSVKVFGSGIKRLNKDTIEFELISY